MVGVKRTLEIPESFHKIDQNKRQTKALEKDDIKLLGYPPRLQSTELPTLKK